MHGLRLSESRGRDPGDRHDHVEHLPGADFLSGCDDNTGADRLPGRDDDTGAHRYTRRDRYARADG